MSSQITSASEQKRSHYKPAGLALVAFIAAATALRVFVFWWCSSNLPYHTCLGVLLTGTGFTMVGVFDIGVGFDGDIKQSSDRVTLPAPVKLIFRSIIDVFFAYATRQNSVEKTLVAFVFDLVTSSKERGVIFRVLNIPGAKLFSGLKILLGGFTVIDQWLLVSACFTCCGMLFIYVPTYYIYTNSKKPIKTADSTPTSIVTKLTRTQDILVNMYDYGAFAAALLISRERVLMRLVLWFLNVLKVKVQNCQH